MKKQLVIGLFGLATIVTSCDKHTEHYGTYNASETRTYDGEMMAGNVDLSDQSYELIVEGRNKEEIVLKNLYEEGTAVMTQIDGAVLTIRRQSLDGFLEITGDGTIQEGVINLDYNFITPDGNVICDLSANLLE